MPSRITVLQLWTDAVILRAMVDPVMSVPPHATALTSANAVIAVLARRGWMLGLARLAAVIATVIAVGLFIAHPEALRFIAILACGAAVLGLGLAQQAIDDRRRQGEALAHFHRRGLERCADRWTAGSATDSPLDHPYAHDLDLVSPHGLLARLGAESSPGGREQLARWALDDTTAIDLARPAAVQALGALHDWRARLAAAVSTIGEQTPITTLVTALRAGFAAPSLGQSLLAWVLRAAGIAALGSALWYWGPDGALTTMLGVAAVLGPIDVALARRFAALGDSDRLRTALSALARGLQVAGELANHTDPLVRRLGQRCATATVAAQQLARHLTSVAQRRDPLWTFLVCGPLQFATRDTRAIAAWAQLHHAQVVSWRDDLAEVEAWSALATWAAEQGGCWPQWCSDGPLLEAKALAHPLLPRDRRSGNDAQLIQGTVWLITGANASGKSTWLRSCALALILARLGTTIPAHNIRLRPMRIAATMRAGDDIAAGLSRFQAEVAALARAWKRIAEPGEPLLLVLDEILAGTNSHERHVATQALMNQLVGTATVSLISTHDLALASLADHNNAHIHLGHFADRAADGSDDLAFDYVLRPGVTQTTNALTVLRRAGIPLSL